MFSKLVFKYHGEDAYKISPCSKRNVVIGQAANVEFKSKFNLVFVFNLLSSKFQHLLYSCSNTRIWKWRNIASSSKFELQLQQHWEWNERRHGSTEECRLTYGEFWIGKTVWIMWCTRSFGHDYCVRHSHFHFCGRFRTVIMNCHDCSRQNASFTSIFFVILSRLCGDSSFALLDVRFILLDLF